MRDFVRPQRIADCLPFCLLSESPLTPLLNRLMAIDNMTDTTTLENILQRARQELLDVSARNRLISTPRGTARTKRIDIVNERAEDVFRILVRENKAMSFAPGHEDADVEQEGVAHRPLLSQPEDGDPSNGGSPARYTDSRLQTRLSSENLQDRLLEMYYDAQTHEQEQGVSILYLAIGFLKWYDSPASDKPRFAPLLLIPVDLERTSVSSRFKVRFRNDDITTNLSLQSKLNGEFAVALPDVPDLDDLSVTGYFDAVQQTIVGQPRWEILRDDLVLWFFSFAKYLMYRDLDPATWPEHSPLGVNPSLNALLHAGFRSEPPVCGDNDKIDALISPENMIHVTDADSSQAVVIEEVRKGRHLVVQGPPGTGKSQTITNIIATAVKEGKRVLFVAEKMAALEVVYRRLDRLGLAPLCLELHSHKANKKSVLDELNNTLNLTRPRVNSSASQFEALQVARERLNRHASMMNTGLEPTELSPFQIIGRLVQLYRKGVESSDFELPQPESWTHSEFLDKCRRLQDLQIHLGQVGRPSEHPWRGVNWTGPFLPKDLKQVLAKVAELVASLQVIVDGSQHLAAALNVQRQTLSHLTSIQVLMELGLAVMKAPPMDRRQMSSLVWQTQRDEIDQLVTRGQALATCQSELAGVVAEDAWSTDFKPTLDTFESHRHSWFPWFSQDYREALHRLKSILAGELPNGYARQLQVIRAIVNVQSTVKSLNEDPACDKLGRETFGTYWRGANSDWSKLRDILKWDQECQKAKLPQTYRQIIARWDSPEKCQIALKTLKEHFKPTTKRMRELFELLALEGKEAFGVDSSMLVPLNNLLNHLQRWQNNPESLSKWIGYQLRRQEIIAEGLCELAWRLHDGRIPAEGAIEHFQLAYYESLIQTLFRRQPDLGAFDGQSYEQAIADFCRLDQNRIDLARCEVATTHYDAIPRGNAGGEMTIIRREIEKKRKHKPIRQLIKEAGTALQAIKPVFMMSPISVAQYLEPGSISFDLLLIDEASQVSPVDAFGAMARAKQMVIVGDSKQLPPTRFFSKMLDDDGGSLDDDDQLNTKDLDSILGLCVAQGMSQRLLRWHYRSRHHSLIAVSNREFYDSNLYVVPSPTSATTESGLRFRHISNGVFDRGGTATNRIEARAVAMAVVQHARTRPMKSLGVGTFSVAQRDAIRDELELLLRQESGLDEFFSSGRSEIFFVKNLENIQGDERDVIFVSVGYARDSSGFLSMGFGPLSMDGGERRLNVLISRARERCEVFSSITADDIDTERAKSRGASVFKTFLRYAATGILDTQKPIGAEYDSDFERQVAETLQNLGYEVHCQIGTAGFIIDLGIVDPDQPGRYLLGIECDGATYHSSRSARDRDRLREAVLKDRGWKLHRVWSTDWFHRPEEQTRKIVSAIEQAKAEIETPARAEFDDAELNGSPVETEIERLAPSELDLETTRPIWVTTYTEATFDVPSQASIPETPSTVLADIVKRIVAIEGPIHTDEIARRITTLWGQQRTGSRIASAIQDAVSIAVGSGFVVEDNRFLCDRVASAMPVRCRDQVSSLTLRKPEMIPPSEIREAAQRLTTDNVGIQKEEVRNSVARLMGFKTTSSQLRDAIDDAINRMIKEGQLTHRENKLFMP